jgi:hypothetical protein
MEKKAMFWASFIILVALCCVNNASLLARSHVRSAIFSPGEVKGESESSYYSSQSGSGGEYKYIIQRAKIGNETVTLGYLHASAEVRENGLSVVKVLLTSRDGTRRRCEGLAVDCMPSEILEKLIFFSSVDESPLTNCTYFQSHEIYSTVLLTCTIPNLSLDKKATKELSLSAYERKSYLQDEWDRSGSSETVYVEKILLHLQTSYVRGVTVCSGIYFSTPEESADEIFFRALTWWQYHRQLGFRRLYLYVKVDKILEMTMNDTNFYAAFGISIVNATLESDIGLKLDNQYKERPYFDQQAALSHCWQHNYIRADWIFNIDIDEFLILPNDTRNITQFLDTLSMNEVPVGRLNLPRIPYCSCTAVNVSTEGQFDKPIDYDILHTRFNFCRAQKGFIQQKYAYRPTLIELPSIHVADIAVGAGQSGLFVDNYDNYDESFGWIDNISGAVLGHNSCTESHKETLARHQNNRYVFDRHFMDLISEINMETVNEVINHAESFTSAI